MRARRVLIASSVLADSRSRARLGRMLPRVAADAVEVVADGEVEASLRRLGARAALERGGLAGRLRAKDLVAFTRFAFADVFPGYSWQELRDGRRERGRGVLCHTAVEIQSAVGCAFDCSYCPYSRFVCVRLDVERFVDRVAELAARRRGQSLYKLNNRTDTFGLEPEYGLSRALVERFAALDGKYLMLYSKGAEVDDLVDVDHRGKTIASFTLTPEPVAALLEPGAPPPSARLAAIEKLAGAGYPIRVRLSPIVPLRGWREAYASLERLGAVAAPDMITLWTLSMIELRELDRIVPVDALDPELRADAERASGDMRGEKGAPFPPPARAAIYRAIAELAADRCPTARISLCLETPDVWDALADMVVPRRGAQFACNCGPRSCP